MTYFNRNSSCLPNFSGVSKGTTEKRRSKNAKKNKINLNLCQLVDEVKKGHLQPVIANTLGVSISTVKRRMSEAKVYEIAKKTSIRTLVDGTEQKIETLDLQTINVLNAAFKGDQQQLAKLLDTKVHKPSISGRSSEAVSLRKSYNGQLNS